MAQAYAVIMAGGSGTRFWPWSRRARPKQMLPLGPTDASLLRETATRIERFIPPERVYVVTSESLADAIRAELAEVPPENVLAEPTGRNTAPCVGWAAARIGRIDPEGVLAVLPADHYIGDEEAFLDVARRCVTAAAHGDLVTVGVHPTRPETGYGYIEVGEELGDGVHRARRFVEKPNRQRAEQLLAAGNFLWNSGMFFFRADTIRSAMRSHLPGLADALDAFDVAAARGEEAQFVQANYGGLPSISIDHGVMEKAERVAVVPGSFGWSDLGSWTSAWELATKDDRGNALPESAIAVHSNGCYGRVERGKLLALVGVSGLVVVDTEDALLVVSRDRAQDVREIVEELKRRGGGPL